MKIFNEFVLSIYAYPKAVKVIPKYGLFGHVFLLLILLFIFVVPVLFIGETLTFISSYIPFVNGEKYAQISSRFLSSFSGFFLLLFLIPIFTLVSDKVNQHIRGISNKFSFTQFLSDILRGIKITLRNLIYQYVSVVGVLILLSVFSNNMLFSLVGNIAIALITSYFYGFSLIDYAMENHQMNYKSSVKFARSHVGLVIGLGTVYYFTISINDLPLFKNILGNIGIYWTSFAEAIIAFIGVITANIVLNITNKS